MNHIELDISKGLHALVVLDRINDINILFKEVSAHLEKNFPLVPFTPSDITLFRDGLIVTPQLSFSLRLNNQLLEKYPEYFI